MRLRLSGVSGLDRDAQLLVLISGITSSSYLGIQQLLRVFYVLRLGHGPEYVGFLGAAGALTYMAVSIPGGALGQRFSSRSMLMVAGLLMVVGMILFPLAAWLPARLGYVWPLASQVVMTTGWTILNVNAIPALMAVTTEASRGSAYAINNSAKNLGTLLGTLLGGVLPGLFAGLLGQSLDSARPYELGLWAGAVFAVVALVPIALLRRTERATIVERVEQCEPFPVGLVVLLAASAYLTHASYSACQAFGGAYMDTELNLSTSSIGLLTSLAQLAAVAASLLTPRLVARYGHRWILSGTALGMAASLIPFALWFHWLGATVGRVGVLALEGMWLPALQAFQMGRVGPRWRSLVYGILSMIMGLSFGVISLAGGYIVAAYSYRHVFLLGAGLATVGAGLMWAASRWRAQAAVGVPTPAQE
jgi:MFS family permease